MKHILGMIAVGSLVAVGGGMSLGTSPAQAQSACFNQCVSNGWGEGQCRGYCYGNTSGNVPGVYGYTTFGFTNPQTNPPASVRRSERRSGGGCGEFFYWNGQECIDSRVTPPGGSDDD